MTDAVRRWLLLALALATLGLALNGRHYWHEVRFAYSVVRFPLQDVLRGGFNPHQAGHEIDEVSSAGFYQTKVLHLAWLSSLFSFVDPARGGFELAVMLSVALMGATAVVARQVFCGTFESRDLADLGLASFLLTPVVPYMAGKLMSEVPALFFASLATLAGQRAVLSESRGRLRWAVGSGLFALLAILSRFDLLLVVIGFWAAVLLTEGRRARKISALNVFWVSSAIAALGYVIVLLLFKIEFRSFVEYLREFTGTGIKSPLMSVVGVVTFGGCIYIAATFAMWSDRRSTLLFFLLWFLASAGPMFVLSSQYMIEPRYLIHGLIPFAGLGALGLEVATKRFSRGYYQAVHPQDRRSIGPVLATALGLVAISSNWVLLSVMPYEVNAPQLLAAVQQIVDREPSAAILTPWSYTDFHFLKVTRPDLPIYNVNGDLLTRGHDSHDAAWQRRLTDWYGDSFLNAPDRLQALLRERPVYYIGWHKYPPIQTVAEWTQTLGLSALSRKVAAMPSKDHLAESWVWRSGDYEFDKRGKLGQYVYYRVRAKALPTAGP